MIDLSNNKECVEMKLRWINAGIAMVLTVTALAGCGASSGGNTKTEAETDKGGEEQITLTYMGWLDNNEDGIRAVADLYEKANPNVKIDVELLESDQYDTVYMARMASGEAADLMSIRYQAADKKNYAAGDYVADLSGQPAVSNLKEGLDQVSAYEGAIQGIPVAADCWGMWYNADMMKELGLEVPKTIDDFRKCCDAAKAAGYVPMANGLQDGWTAWMSLWTLWGKAGEKDPALFDRFQVGEAVLSDVPEVEWAFETALEYYKAGYYPDNVLGTSQDSAVQLWYNKEALFCPNGSFFLPEVQAANPDFKYGFCKQPYNETEQEDICAQGGYTFSMAAYKKGKHVDEAVDFINFFFEPENYQVYVDNAGVIGTTIEGVTAGDSEAAAEIGECITSMNTNLHPGNAQDAALDGFSAVFAGVKTPEEVVADMDRMLKESLTK